MYIRQEASLVCQLYRHLLAAHDKHKIDTSETLGMSVTAQLSNPAYGRLSDNRFAIARDERAVTVSSANVLCKVLIVRLFNR